MSQPPRISGTGSSRLLSVDRPNNHSRPLTMHKSSSELEVSSAGGPGGTGGTSPRAVGGTNDPVPYDWRAFTTNAQLHYIRTEDTANECIARIASRPSPLAIGLDLEWRPTFTPRRRENPIALVQLACDDEILLMQVSAMPVSLRPVLSQLFPSLLCLHYSAISMQGALAPIALLIFASCYLHGTAAVDVPSFLPQSFLFDWNPLGTTVPIPVTEQCSTLHIKWTRGSGAVGYAACQSPCGRIPAAPYFLQIFTSTFIVPITVPAGGGTSFDFVVPWVPGTQYQICMWASNGASGGCQGIYTNVTYPTSAMSVDAAVVIRSPCVSIFDTVNDGCVTPGAQIAPTLHPPLLINSTTDNPIINWTVSLSHGFPFFISLEDSQGNVWAQGPLHSGDGPDTSCLDLNHSESGSGKSSSHLAPTIGAAAGGIVVGLLVGGAGILLFKRRRSRSTPARQSLSHNNELGQPHSPREVTGVTSGGHLGPGGLEYIVEPFSIPGSSSSDPSAPLLPGGAPSPPSSPPDATSASGSTAPTDPSSGRGGAGRTNVYVVHHDGGRAPVTVYTEEGAEVVELPPRYADSGGSSSQDGRSQDGRSPVERKREPAAQPRKTRGPRPPT
ncbi:hypothetical protein EDB92DRAFT_1859586 [Lactarius akahatsu]|uniref:Uncharacterized protein n=1 Tax=Lactarius akahatsu TaxID=416441 RepID=A0AAD4LHH3_9AGAM|nr:hypothetical protein EDB92DRAFT_1859586 [Lactarius akahatsu]